MLKKSLILIGVLYANLNASAVDSRFSYQDYLDFGANKGKFKAGATGLGVSSKDGTLKVDSFSSMPMIDFSASNQTGVLRGEFTNIGGNKAVSAAHMMFGNQANSLHRYSALQFGGVLSTVVSTSNNFANWTCATGTCGQEDFLELRMSKVNLNKKADLAPIKYYDANGKDTNYEACKNGGFSCSDKSGKAALYDSSRYSLFVRSGTGLQKVNKIEVENKGGYDYYNVKSDKVADANLYFTGGVTNNIDDYESFRQEFGIYTGNFNGKDLLPFSSTGAKGDSGSALYVWDNVDKKWYLVGVVSVTNCNETSTSCTYTNYHLVNNNTIDSFDKAHRVDTSAVLTLDGASLKAGTLELEKTLGANSFKHHYAGAISSLNPNYASFKQRIDAMENDKDIYISGGSLTLSANSDLGSSALIIKDNLTYEIKGDFDFLHGGLDIGANSVVNYYAKTTEYDFLHKIGAGKLNVYSSSPNAGLRIGGGEVELKNTLGTTFGSIYMTNNSSLKINNANQVNTDYLYFGNNAGQFNLNGNNIALNNFYASDSNAIIINTSTAVSSLSISKNLTKDTISHGAIKGNISISQNNNSNKTHHSVYDGGLDVNSMEFKNGNLVFQGHPVVHEYVSETVKTTLGEDVFTTPTRLDQEDWEYRNYKMASLTLDNANLNILKHSNVEITDINSTNSTIKIGDNIAFIDKFDGENIKANDTMGSDGNEDYRYNLKYQEEVSSGYSKAQNIFVNSNFDLKTNSKLSLLNGTNYKGKITADDTSSLEFNGVIINADINASSLSSTNTTYIYESSANALNISKSTSGANNKLLIKKDFLNGADRLLLASLSNPTLVNENYFIVEGESSAFAILKPNVKYYNENGVAKWYLEKIGATPPDPTDPTTPPDNPDDKPQNPDPTDPQPFDPNPENNPSNTETPGYYDEYFFVKENTNSIQTAEHSLNQIFFNYVLEWNNMQKRMGELRDDIGDAGVWIRAYGGESSFLKEHKTKYTEVQIGADKRTEFDDFVNYTGVIFTSSTYNIDSKISHGKINAVGGGLYTSFIYNDGFYIDMIAKYVGYKNDFNITFKNGKDVIGEISANNNTYNALVSIESGFRKYIFYNFYFEPSFEIISGYVGSQSIQNHQKHITLKTDSFIPLNLKSMVYIGKTSDICDDFGFRFGVGLASDLVKNGDKTIRDINVIRKIEGKKDQRTLVNLAFNYNFTNTTKIHAEFEKTFGGDMNVEYAANLTLRKSF